MAHLTGCCGCLSNHVPRLFLILQISNLSVGKGVPMAGETELHKTLKKEACRWLFRMGYRAIAAEVRLPPLGIIDAVGTGVFKSNHNYLFVPYELPQVCFIECKATRSDFLRDMSNDGQLDLYLTQRRRRRRAPKRRVGLGKFDSCLVCQMANLMYVL